MNKAACQPLPFCDNCFPVEPAFEFRVVNGARRNPKIKSCFLVPADPLQMRVFTRKTLHRKR
jgi:hypothetical protein